MKILKFYKVMLFRLLFFNDSDSTLFNFIIFLFFNSFQKNIKPTVEKSYPTAGIMNLIIYF
jgi:hypothetical protein